MQDAPTLPAFVLVSLAAATLGVSRRTVRRWVDRGRLRGIQYRVQLHYTDDRPRKPSYGGHWRVEVESIRELLEEAYAGSPVPNAIKAKLASLGKSPKGPSSK